MLKVTVDGNSPEPRVFDLDQQKNTWLIGGEPFDGDIVEIKKDHYHVIWKNRSFSVEVIESDVAAKTFKIKVNGQVLSTSAKSEFDMLLEGLGLQTVATQKINNVKSPMPGLIQSVAVQDGDEVTKGDTLLVLVAMKMENIIKASGSGTVKSLKIMPGQIVEKNQVLLEFL